MGLESPQTCTSILQHTEQQQQQQNAPRLVTLPVHLIKVLQETNDTDHKIRQLLPILLPGFNVCFFCPPQS